ncbi:MAG: DUF418 domain-containing protein [Ignavibacteria bacterium]|nr:DUF418 domain-containing protein [Ignavibacteria bacterium]
MQNTVASTEVQFQPVQPQERIETIDILRGFAIFGILIVNMAYFNSPVYLIIMPTDWWTGTVDRVAQGLIRFAAEGKFITLFSFLFGLGLAIQMLRAEEQGKNFLPFYRRRLVVLFIVGLIHAFLIWHGDILVPYAIFGFVLLLFRNRKPKTLIVWAIVLLLIPALLTGLGATMLELGRMVPEAGEQIDAQFAQQAEEYRELSQRSIEAYSQGGFSEIFAQRLDDLRFNYMGLVFYFTNIFAMFLIGLYVGRRRIFSELPTHQNLIRRTFWWGLVLGISGNLIYALAREYSIPSEPTLLSFVSTAGFAFGGPALCLFYAAALTRLSMSSGWKRRLAPLAAVGRFAISNYLLQSVICTLIFYNYGLGFYGEVGPAAGLVLTVAIFSLQIVLSRWWIRRYRFGPVEWLWRSLTYRRRQPMVAG